jgi:adenosylcobinamide-phosphate synthase
VIESIFVLNPPSKAVTFGSAAFIFLLSYTLPLAKQYDPLTIVVLLANKIDLKARPDNGIKQQLISGSLSYLVIFSPLLLLIGLLLSLAEFRLFFDGLLLYVACSFAAQKQKFHKVKYALKHEKKVLARQWLSALVKRQTSSLSNIGTSKAAIEALLLRFVYQMVTSVFIFLIAGSVAALAYRIALECYWEWKRPYSEEIYYAYPVGQLCKLAQAIPMLLTCLIAFIFLISTRRSKHINKGKVAVSQPVASLSQLQPWLFHIVGNRIGISLGGPLQYGSTKQRLPKYGAPYQLTISDMDAVSVTLNVITIIISVGLCICAMLMRYFA